MRKLVVLALLAISASGCIPIIAGALIVKSSKSKGQKQEFMNQLQQTNADRESRGLQPLDWCSEAYRFDKGWAMEDTGCAVRVKAYEAGDPHALETPALPPPAVDSSASANGP
jgi:hypothetical protein